MTRGPGDRLAIAEERATRRKPKPLRWDETRGDDVEARAFEVITYGVGGHQHRGMDVRCPFCARIFLVYPWSLAGSGKRCECGALLGRSGDAYRRKETQG